MRHDDEARKYVFRWWSKLSDLFCNGLKFCIQIPIYFSNIFSNTRHHHHHHHHHHHLSLNREGHCGTTDDFTTSFLHFSLFSTALWELANFRPVHFLMLSSHLFLCLPCLLPLFIKVGKMVLARSDERQTCPYHCSLRPFTKVRRSSCGPIACWMFARTSSLVTWSLYDMVFIHLNSGQHTINLHLWQAVINESVVWQAQGLGPSVNSSSFRFDRTRRNSLTRGGPCTGGLRTQKLGSFC